MIVNHNYRFIFFHVPKTAGSSIRAALLRDLASIDFSKPTKHLTPAEFLRGAPWGSVEKLKGYYSFGFARDPWERFGSLHRFLVLRHRDMYRVPEDLDDFALALAERPGRLQPRHSTRPQVDFLDGLSFVGRYERLEDDLRHIAKALGIRHLTLKHANRSGEPTIYREKMSARSEAIIADYYREDIRRFGYG